MVKVMFLIKSFLYRFVLFMMGVNLVSGQNVINNPTVEKGIESSDYEVRITKVDNSKEFTAIYLEVKNSLYYSNSISFDPKNRYKLVDVKTGRTFKLLNDMPTRENAVKIRARESFVFYLKFEKIPGDVIKVNLMQGDRTNGWNFLGIDTDFDRYHLEVSQKKSFTGIVFDDDLSSIGIIELKLEAGVYTVKMFDGTDVYHKTDQKNFFRNKSDSWAISVFRFTDKDDKLTDIEGTIYSNNYGYSSRYWFVGYEGSRNQVLKKKSGTLKLEMHDEMAVRSIAVSSYIGSNKYIKKGTQFISVKKKMPEEDFDRAISFINYDFGKHSYSMQGLTKVIGKTRNDEYQGPVISYKLNRYGDEPATPFYYIGEYQGMFFSDGIVRSYNLKNEQTEECKCKDEILSCKQLISTIAQKKFAEFLGASSILVAGTSKLIELAASTGAGSRSGSSYSSNSEKDDSEWKVKFASKNTKTEVRYSKVDKQYVTVSISSLGEANDKKNYFSSVTIKDKSGTAIDSITCEDPFEDNGLRNKFSYIKFNQSAGEYAEIRVAYGHKEFRYFEKDGYLGIGSIIRIVNNSGDYNINVFPKN